MNFNVDQAPIYRAVSAEAIACNNNNNNSSRSWDKKYTVLLKHPTRKVNNICTEGTAMASGAHIQQASRLGLPRSQRKYTNVLPLPMPMPMSASLRFYSLFFIVVVYVCHLLRHIK